MNLKHLKATFLSELSKQYSREESLAFFYLLTESYLGLGRASVSLQIEKPLGLDTIAVFDKAIKRLLQFEPIQYILNQCFFYGLEFFVSPDVLIPRPETEEIVTWIISDFNSKIQSELCILDLCTGSGCIAIALAKNFPRAKITALDQSQKALEVAKQNAEKHQVSIQFVQADIFELTALSETYHIIVSNPPYVRDSEKKSMRPNVLWYEPPSALYVRDHDPLVFYKKISSLFAGYYSKNRANQTLEKIKLYLEVNQYLANDTRDLLQSLGAKELILRKDYFGNPRMIRACF